VYLGPTVLPERLLVETRLPEETLLSTAMFFLGFLAILAFVVRGPDWVADTAHALHPQVTCP
jgi:hypothetical protein